MKTLAYDQRECRPCVLERRYGRFERRLRLPGYVDPERVEARYENGVLRLQLPKTEEGKERQIEIK